MSTSTTSSAALRDYLATHDAQCPSCGYVLKGCTAANCPECGLALRLALQRHQRGRVWQLMMIIGCALALLLIGRMLLGVIQPELIVNEPMNQQMVAVGTASYLTLPKWGAIWFCLAWLSLAGGLLAFALAAPRTRLWLHAGARIAVGIGLLCLPIVFTITLRIAVRWM